MKEHQEHTKRTPRDPPKLHFYYPKCGCKFAARLQEKIWERARESEEKFGQHEVTMRVHVKMRRGGLLLRERGRGDPPCMLSKCHSMQGRPTPRGAHHEEGGHTMRERKLSFRGWEPPLLCLNISLGSKGGTQGVGPLSNL
jgi:hypothetical protein